MLHSYTFTKHVSKYYRLLSKKNKSSNRLAFKPANQDNLDQVADVLFNCFQDAFLTHLELDHDP